VFLRGGFQECARSQVAYPAYFNAGILHDLPPESRSRWAEPGGLRGEREGHRGAGKGVGKRRKDNRRLRDSCRVQEKKKGCQQATETAKGEAGIGYSLRSC